MDENESTDSVRITLLIANIYNPARKKHMWVTYKKTVRGGSTLTELNDHIMCYWSLANSIYMNNSILLVMAELKFNSELRLLCEDSWALFTLLWNENDNNLWVINQSDGEHHWTVNQQPGPVPAWLIIVSAPQWSNRRRSVAWDVNRTLAFDGETDLYLQWR